MKNVDIAFEKPKKKTIQKKKLTKKKMMIIFIIPRHLIFKTEMKILF